jgi:Fe-S oxidoreductase
VLEAYPDFATWAAGERLEEARSVGAEAIVTACGWCKRTLAGAADARGTGTKVFDIVDLVRQAL